MTVVQLRPYRDMRELDEHGQPKAVREPTDMDRARALHAHAVRRLRAAATAALREQVEALDA
jgi:dGTP triphosphohydrolase